MPAIAEIRTRTKFQPWAAGLLALGLPLAIAVDGELSAVWMKGLFGVLMVLNLLTIEWLTRPKGG